MFSTLGEQRYIYISIYAYIFIDNLMSFLKRIVKLKLCSPEVYIQVFYYKICLIWSSECNISVA